jgi:hypothetical protein
MKKILGNKIYASSWKDDDENQELKDFALFILKGSSSLATKGGNFRMMTKNEGTQLIDVLYEDFKKLGPVN